MKKLMAALTALILLWAVLLPAAPAEDESNVNDDLPYGQAEYSSEDGDELAVPVDEPLPNDAGLVANDLDMFDDEPEAGDDDFEGYSFADEGYTGTWVRIDALNMQLCLPDGWKAVKARGKAVFSARNGAKTASMNIYRKAKKQSSLNKWANQNLSPGTVEETVNTGFYDALVVSDHEKVMSVFIRTDVGTILQFKFKRTEPEAIDRELALEIVSSLYEDWFDDEELEDMLEDEEEETGDSFDFSDIEGENAG